SRAPHRSSRDNVDLRIQYIEGTSSKDREEIIEIQGWGFLAPLLPCKPFFLVAVLAICAGLLSRAKETLIRMFLSLMIIGYGAVLVATGIYGTFFVPGDALRNIENSSFGGLILYPLYGLSWLTFVLSLVTGVFIIARKKWAVAGGICVQAALFFSIPFTLSVAAGRPPCYRVEILSPVFYSSVSIPLLLLAVWFFTRSKVRARFTERRIDPTAFTP
ncbi:MAG: hypothetical protein JXD19_05690, partial [Deltaproteobacteria bacterium]|nr:hypothetical protein [Deltaproteobacteria bacterium]